MNCRNIFPIILSFFLAVSCSAGRSVSSGEGKTGGVDPVNTVKMKDKESRSFSNIYEYLRAKVPGLQIRGTDVSIRGVSSINSPAPPLFLVDGVEMPDISGLSPQDVVGVEVIKDSASAIYGFKGAGGVIKITTKAGEGRE